MVEFDIANMRGKSSYAAQLQKRRALGLYDSDSDDETPKKKKATLVQSKAKKEENEKAEKKNILPQEEEPALLTAEDYLQAADLLDSRLSNPQTATPTAPKPVPETSTSNLSIELSDEEEPDFGLDEGIEDLDPSILEAMNDRSAPKSYEPQKVAIKLHYVAEAVTPEQKMENKQLTKPIKVLVMDTDQFHKVVGVFCEKKSLEKANIVLTYKDDKVFLSSTPKGLHMSAIETNYMSVYSQASYDKMMEKKAQERADRLQKRVKEEEDIKFQLPAESEQEEINDDAEKIILKLGGKGAQEISLRVRRTATLRALVNSYKQHTKTTRNIKLSFEGEQLDLDNTIEDTDFEDEDQVEVILC